jgi:hypothetical protein
MNKIFCYIIIYVFAAYLYMKYASMPEMCFVVYG